MYNLLATWEFHKDSCFILTEHILHFSLPKESYSANNEFIFGFAAAAFFLSNFFLANNALASITKYNILKKKKK